MTERDPERDGDPQRVVVRDKRRVDASGAVRDPDPDPVRGEDEVAADTFVELRRLEALLEERTADLQRMKAEYDNYRKRIERDRTLMAEQSIAAVLAHLLPVLDDMDRAREHEELTGGFKSVAEGLEAALVKLGLERFGDPGEPFDPLVHEAVTHQHSANVTEPTCVAVLRPGYRFADRLLRPAMVSVAEPAEPAEAPAPADAAGG
ncbi:MAG: molecular chaperone GrpE [Frankiaceae bacterium]|jgi:molecular chaperone GrpE|nr:molecular chaperone GrpE [Frankiaceae bacterium]